MALNDEQIQKVRLLLMSGGWTDVVQPLLALRAQAAIKALILTPAERTGEFKELDDDSIRGRIRGVEWLLAVLKLEVEAYDHNRRMDELQRQENPDSSNPSTANP